MGICSQTERMKSEFVHKFDVISVFRENNDKERGEYLLPWSGLRQEKYSLSIIFAFSFRSGLVEVNWWFLLSPLLPMSVSSISNFPTNCQIPDQVPPHGINNPISKWQCLVFHDVIPFFRYLINYHSPRMRMSIWRIFISEFPIDCLHQPPVRRFIFA